MALNIQDFDLLAFSKMAEIHFGVGAVMAKLNGYAFFMHQNDFKRISESMTADFSFYKPIKGQEIAGDSGGFHHNITLNGVLVAQPLNALDPFKYMLMNREPLVLSTLTFDYDVLMMNISLGKEKFGLIGDHRVQSYTISLKRIYGAKL